MIGNTNAFAVGVTVPTEKVNLTITSNQSSADDLIGTAFDVIYGLENESEYVETYTWEGSSITLDIPQYVTYTIVFGEIVGYKTPETIIFTAVPDNIRQITAEYQTEVVTVTVSADNGASVSGQTVTINGVTTTLTATGVVSQKVPYGTSYSVSVSGLSGYILPTTQTFTASQPARSVSMVYGEIRLGVFIQDTTGKLWTSDAWDDTATPNGVAVLTEDCRFVIALSGVENIYLTYEDSASIPDTPVYSSKAKAITDYSGSSNTTEMVSTYGNDTDEAAGYCANFTFPNGKKGYLGAAGEWQAAKDNSSAVETCMSTAGGTAINGSKYYWSSTRGTTTNYTACFWRLFWNTGSWDTSYAYTSAQGTTPWCARPFCAIDVSL